MRSVSSVVDTLDGLGPHFGLGRARGRVDRRAAVAMAAAAAVLVVAELTLAGTTPR